MGIDNETAPKDATFSASQELRQPTRKLLPSLPVQSPLTTQPLQRQLEQQQHQTDKLRVPEVTTGELKRRSSDIEETMLITPEQRAASAAIISIVTETPISPSMRENPAFAEAVDRFYNVMYPVMRGTEEERRKSAAEAAVIAARNDVHRQEEIIAHKADTRVALEKLNSARLLAETDELTQILNRRGIDRQLLQSLLASDEPFVALEVDLNLLKLLNDNFGESAGDGLLVATAKALKQAVRATDAVGRRGGDEMLVLLRNVNIAQAKQIIARQIDPHLEAHKIPEFPGQSISLGGGFVEVNPKEYQGLSDDALNAKIDDMLKRLLGAMKTAKDMAKSDASVSKRAYVDANSPEALARYEQIKGDKTVQVNFMR